MSARGSAGRDDACGRGVRRRTAAVLFVAALMLLGAACDAGAPAPPEPTRSPIGPAGKVTFGAFGTEEELSAYTAITDNFNGLYDGARVELQTWPDQDDLMASVEKGDVPDVFMVSRDNLAWLQDQGLTQPVDTLLDERGVDFGDGYSRDGLQAFSADDRLQCMPYAISPMVMFYNKALVDFERMENRGLPVPPEPDAWSFESFVAAAEFATRPRLGTRGVYVAPRLRTLAPFIYSGGGQLFDDPDDPTSLAFSEGGTRDALERALVLLRDPRLTLTEDQLAKRSPLDWFKRGKLAMIEGYRRLVPELRQVQGLEFDVIGMPVLDSSATVGEVTGLCLSAEVANTPAAADFMVQLLSTPSVQRVAHAGYMVPANLEVALSDDFLQPGRLPEHSSVFNSTVRSIVIPPLLSTWPELEAAVSPSLQQMLSVQVLDDLEALTERIDEESRVVLDPETASPSPSE